LVLDRAAVCGSIASGLRVEDLCRYRIFADLLELAIQSGLRIPALAPPTFPTAAASAAPPASDYFCTPISSGNPLQVLQQPAFYFYTAACCSVQRQKRFEEALAVEFDQDSSEAGAASGYVSTAPGFANEKKVDHAALVIELFTKAYSLLKDQDYPQTRMALFVAFRIAETYCQSGQHEMAMRFFDRISPSFRRERWQPIVRQIRGLWYECAQRTDSIETAARIVFEMMCPGSGIGGEERNALKDDLISLFKTTAPSTTEPIVFDMADLPLLDVRAGFWQSTAVLSDTAAFKVVLTCPETVNISNLGFSAMYISFSDGRPDVVVAASGSADFVFVGVVKQTGATDAAEASLRWNANRSLVISGTLPSDVEGEVSISAVKLVLNEGVWNVQLVFSPHDLEDWLTPNGVLAPIQDLSSSVMFQPQPHLITLAVTHQASAYVDESFDLLVKVENRDEREMDIRLSVFLQPADEEDSASISMDDQESRSLLKDIPLAILNPKTSVEKVVHLRSPHPGTKIIDFSLHSIVSWASSPNLAPDSRSEQTNRAEEVNHTAVIPVLAPFECVFALSYRQSGSASASGGDAVVSTTIRAPGPRAVHAESLKVRAKEGNEAEIRSCSLEQTISESFPQTWDRSTSFSVMSKFAILPGCKPSSLAVQTSSPAELVLLWRSDDTAILTETVVALPPLMLPPQESFVTPLLLPPASVRLHASFPLILRVRNSHPTLSASRLSVQVDTAEAFVWHGSRSARISEILPGETGELRLEMMAVGGTGWFALPRVKVWDGEGERRSEIKVLNGRAQENAGIGKDGLLVLVRP